MRNNIIIMAAIIVAVAAFFAAAHFGLGVYMACLAIGAGVTWFAISNTWGAVQFSGALSNEAQAKARAEGQAVILRRIGSMLNMSIDPVTHPDQFWPELNKLVEGHRDSLASGDIRRVAEKLGISSNPAQFWDELKVEADKLKSINQLVEALKRLFGADPAPVRGGKILAWVQRLDQYYPRVRGMADQLYNLNQTLFVRLKGKSVFDGDLEGVQCAVGALFGCEVLIQKQQKLNEVLIQEVEALKAKLEEAKVVKEGELAPLLEAAENKARVEVLNGHVSAANGHIDKALDVIGKLPGGNRGNRSSNSNNRRQQRQNDEEPADA